MTSIDWNGWFEDNAAVKNDLSELVGEILQSVTGLETGSEEVVFVTKSGKAVKLWHEQDCCENVDLNDIDCDVTEFDGSLVVSAEEVSSEEKETEWGSETWTFYKVETDRGGIWMRWHGESNGYYSESVTITGGTVEE